MQYLKTKSHIDYYFKIHYMQQSQKVMICHRLLIFQHSPPNFVHKQATSWKESSSGAWSLQTMYCLL